MSARSNKSRRVVGETTTYDPSPEDGEEMLAPKQSRISRLYGTPPNEVAFFAVTPSRRACERRRRPSLRRLLNRPERRRRYGDFTRIAWLSPLSIGSFAVFADCATAHGGGASSSGAQRTRWCCA
jgi:hypothetical protein